MKTRRKRTTYCVARERQSNGLTVIKVHADWGNFTPGVLMPLLEIQAYDAAEAMELFNRYLKRWSKNPDAKIHWIIKDGKQFEFIPGPKTHR